MCAWLSGCDIGGGLVKCRCVCGSVGGLWLGGKVDCCMDVLII